MYYDAKLLSIQELSKQVSLTVTIVSGSLSFVNKGRSSSISADEVEKKVQKASTYLEWASIGQIYIRSFTGPA